MVPPTIAPTFTLLPKETEIEEGRGKPEVKGKGSNEEVLVEKPVAVVAEPGLPINAPEAISGLSIKCRCEAAKEKTVRKMHTTCGHRFGRVPAIFELAYRLLLVRVGRVK
jgi:hypothetical protein